MNERNERMKEGKKRRKREKESEKEREKKEGKKRVWWKRQPNGDALRRDFMLYQILI